MKTITKFLALAFIISIISADCFAGGDDKIGGIRAGYHSANVYIDGSKVDADPLNSFYVGYYKNNRIVPVLNWGFGLEYFQNGYKVNDDNKLKLGYLSVPLNLKLKLGPVVALGGVAPSVKITDKYTFLGTTNPDGYDKAKSFDAPLFVGGGFEFLMFTIEARYHWGTVDLYDSGERNRYLQIGAGVSF